MLLLSRMVNGNLNTTIVKVKPLQADYTDGNFYKFKYNYC